MQKDAALRRMEEKTAVIINIEYRVQSILQRCTGTGPHSVLMLFTAVGMTSYVVIAISGQRVPFTPALSLWIAASVEGVQYME